MCTAEAYHGKGISSLKRSRLRLSIVNDTTLNLRGPLGLRRLNLKAVGPSTGRFMPPTGPWRQRGPPKVAWGPTEVGQGGPVLREGPKVTLSVLFSPFINQEFVLKQLAELKEGHLRTSDLSSYPLVTHSALECVLSRFWGPWSTNWALSGLRWPP